MLFGISPLGWVHTLGSLPAIPVAIYMFTRHGRIVPRSIPGAIYFASFLIGGVTVFVIATQPVSYFIGAAALALLFGGYGVGLISGLGRAGRYIETIFLSLTAFVLMVPTLKETLTRVPNGHPIVASPQSPILIGSELCVVLTLIVGLTAQMLHLRKRHKAVAQAT